jgi:hypothetical protein
MKKQKLPKWYYDLELTVDAKSSEVVTNNHTHKKCTLTPEELAMYDLINGMQMMAESMGGVFSPRAQEPNNIKNKGLQWFRETNPKAYEILFTYE